MFKFDKEIFNKLYECKSEAKKHCEATESLITILEIDEDYIKSTAEKAVVETFEEFLLCYKKYVFQIAKNAFECGYNYANEVNNDIVIIGGKVYDF